MKGSTEKLPLWAQREIRSLELRAVRAEEELTRLRPVNQSKPSKPVEMINCVLPTYPHHEWPVIRIPVDITPDEWDRVIAILTVMREASTITGSAEGQAAEETQHD